MLICPNCQKKNMPGAIYCMDCGVQLISDDGETIEQDPGGSTSSPARESGSFAAASLETPDIPADSKIALYLLENNEIIPLIDREEITFGRAIEDQSIIPDIDLTPYNGYEKGVSRLHASITIDGNHVTITDLGSANGTRVNGNRLAPNQSQAIVHGDLLTFGKLQTQVLIRS